MKVVPILTVLSSAVFGFFVGISFPVEITPKLPYGPLFPFSGGANSSYSGNILGRFWAPYTNSSLEEAKSPKRAESKLPPGIVVSESDFHLRRLWGAPSDDEPARKYLLALGVGYDQRENVNLTVQKFIARGNFDVVLFHYDGRTTEWDDEFDWSKRAVHVSARKQTKWWFAKRFLHPSVVAAYEYLFVWDEDLGLETFDPEEYIRIMKKHGMEISQPGLDTTRGTKSYDQNVRWKDTEVHKKYSSCDNPNWGPPCSGFVEMMAPVFTKDAWRCVWYLIQNDLVHAWGLDLNFHRCVDDYKEHMGIVDAQYVAHHGVKTLEGQGDGEKEGSSAGVRARQLDERRIFYDRLANADRELANSTASKTSG
ncbi:uncharacterized protein LOC100845122 [Brachypodium distachyon]|uniref:Uncharacterized protein n=1 Tax=Brachypodium distachyon TaxID=15368 RepID=A0A0Q3LE69_BRADI|nr:uncharacterized protein LOC100845122 [Brachypodium distachyon]KQJ90917.1 hypothetical protein BRADI_4g34580v3 [Brachypodium distachyon]|eukprot:XP_014758024.1 uncharacterized protein LOC100845122 [Brachypodium distachyon]